MNLDELNSLDYERIGPVGRFFKHTLVDPLVNWVVPASLTRWLLRVGRSEMAQASWSDPGGWRSMVLSYRQDKPTQVADRFLLRLGTMPRALRNRRKLASEIIARLIRERNGQRTNVVCLGSGPGIIVMDAMERSGHCDCHAYMIDLNADSFAFGRQIADQKKLADRVRFIHGDVAHYRSLCDAEPHIVEMVGICEYLSNEVIEQIVQAIADIMPSGDRLVVNSLTRRHGTDRFFRRVMDLHMIHRSANQVSRLLGKAGIRAEYVVTEPLGVYDVLVCRRE